MIPSMEGVMNEFHRLADETLIAVLKREVERERHVTLKVLLLLIVVESRKLHVDRYSSLFAYCTDQLRYSSSAAGRRIAAARCLRDYPSVWPMLFDGRLNLTTLCILARVITPANADELLARASGGSQRQVEELAVQFGGRKPVRDRIKPVRTLFRSPRQPSRGGKTDQDLERSPHCDAQSEYDVDESLRRQAEAGRGLHHSPRGGSAEPVHGDASCPTPAGSGQPNSDDPVGGQEVLNGNGAGPRSDSHPEHDGSKTQSDQSSNPESPTEETGGSANQEPLTYEIIFRTDAAFVQKLRRLLDLLSGDPNPPLGPIFDRAVEAALDRYDPERRESRRQARRARKEARAEYAMSNESAADGSDESRSKSPAVGSRPSSGHEYDLRTPVTMHLDECGLPGSAPNADNESDDRNRATAHRSESREPSADPGSDDRNPDTAHRSESRLPSSARRPRLAQRRRKVPQWVRDFVFLRDGKQCSHVGSEGRCPVTHGLEIDHAEPRGKGGSDDLDNLRAYCRLHNQRAAELAYGTEFMRDQRGRASSLRQNRTNLALQDDSVSNTPRAGVPVGSQPGVPH